MLRVIGNFLWFILGGIFMGLSWWFVGFLCFISVVVVALVVVSTFGLSTLVVFLGFSVSLFAGLSVIVDVRWHF